MFNALYGFSVNYCEFVITGCSLVLHWCNSKIKQLQHIHKPHVTF